jgi:MFS transporter, Spinster family, sphingosine-1-phosphate transporter
MLGGISVHFAVAAAQFDQLWFVQERGFDKAEIAQIAGLLTVIGGVAGNIFGGVVGDWWLQRFGSGRPMMLFWLLLLFAPLNIAFRLVSPDSPILYLGIALGVFQLAAFYGPTFSTVQQLAPANGRATITALYILGLNAIGLGIGITITGLLVDMLRSGGSAQPYTEAALIMTALSFIALPCFYLAGRWFNRDLERLQNA